MLFHVIPHYSTFYQNICAFLWLFRYFLLPLYHHSNTYQFLNKILAMASGKAESSNYSNFFPKVFNYGPHAVGSNVLPLCSTADRLAETPFSPE